jgi:hypothetical protein
VLPLPCADLRAPNLISAAPQAVADRFETRTDSLNAKVQSALLHKQVKARLRPGCEDLLSEVRAPPPAAPLAALAAAASPAAATAMPATEVLCREAAWPARSCADWPLLACSVPLLQKGCAKSRAPTLELNKKRLKLEGLLTWQKFEAAYLKPRN